MESCPLQSSTMATVSTRFPNNGIRDRSLVFGQSLEFPRLCKHPLARKLKIVDVKAQSSGTPKFSSLSAGAIPGEGDVKDENLAFVAGATGRVGSRTVRELLKLGFRVRAAVRSAQRAEALVQSVKQMKLDAEGVQAVERLEIIECDLEKPNQIGPALGNASVVLCCIGAGEKEVFDITGPYRIDYLATKNLIDAATVANVDHFLMVSSLGTNKVGFPAAILNLFWGVLIWKRKAEEALIASGIPYTIVRPGGMERPTDAYKETHNLFLSEEDTLFGGQVSNLQVAELMAFMAMNRRLSYCKVVEVIAETTAPLTPMDKLLEKIPSQRALPEELGREDQAGPATKPELAASEVVVPQTSTTPIEPEPIEAKKTGTKPLSPYTAYEDLKPPTSPTPTAPDGSILSTASFHGGPNTGNSSPTTAPIAVQVHLTGQKPTPLSPYTMYEDLKPPTTPSPSPRKSS